MCKTKKLNEKNPEVQRDYRPSEQEKRLLHNLFEWERRGKESLKDCIVGIPRDKNILSGDAR